MQHFNIDLAVATLRRRSKKRRGNDTIGFHRLPTCASTGKVRYRDHAQARDGLVSAKENRLRDERDGRVSRRREVRSYKCPDCGGWHNTSIAQWIERPHEGPAIAPARSISARSAA